MKQSLSSVKDFLASLHHNTSEWFEEHKKLGGNTAWTADLNWPKGYSIACDVMLSL